MPSTDLASGNCDIATAAELRQRLAERAAPMPQHNLTPGRSDALAVNSEVADANERRIDFIRSRLEEKSLTVQRDHALSKLEGKAKVDFDIER